jgi:hypothetical protein
MAVGSPTSGRWPMAPTAVGNGSKSMQLGPPGATGPTAGPNGGRRVRGCTYKMTVTPLGIKAVGKNT